MQPPPVPPDLLHPTAVLYSGAGKPFPALAVCEHFAGSEKLIRKALALQQQLGPIFDITADCEDGAPAGLESDHAAMIARLISSPDNAFGRLGVRIHDVRHPAWQAELRILLAEAGQRLAYLVLPKPECAEDARQQIEMLDQLRAELAIERAIAVHVLIETP